MFPPSENLQFYSYNSQWIFHFTWLLIFINAHEVLCEASSSELSLLHNMILSLQLTVNTCDNSLENYVFVFWYRLFCITKSSKRIICFDVLICVFVFIGVFICFFHHVLPFQLHI